VTTLEVERDNEPERIVAGIDARRTLHTSGLRGEPTVAAVENLVLVQPDRRAHAVVADVGDELVEFGAVDERKQLRERVERKCLRQVVGGAYKAGQSSTGDGASAIVVQKNLAASKKQNKSTRVSVQ